jgi:hypothetical protein
MRRLAACLALALAPTLVGCPDWSRPDPALRAARPSPAVQPDSGRALPAAPAGAPATEAPAPTAAALQGELERLRAEVQGLGAGSPASAWQAATDRLNDLEGRAYAAQDRGSAADQEAVVALLEALALLRDDLVSKTPGR